MAVAGSCTVHSRGRAPGSVPSVVETRGIQVYQAFILAAGLGTRLRPLTAHRPKPLVPVCGVPLLEYSLALCAAHGITDVVVNAHWLAEQVQAWEGAHRGVRVSVSTELPDILGTGGGLRRVADDLAARFVVLNADVLHNVDLTALLERIGSGQAAMALRPHDSEADRYGIVAADDDGVVARLTSLAAATPSGHLHEDTHFTGIHALDRAVLERVPDGFACIVRTAYASLVPERQVRGLRYLGPWLDAGDPAAYLEANLAVLRGEVPLALDPLSRAAFATDGAGRRVGQASARQSFTVRGAAWVGPGARLAEGVVLEDSIVGHDATVPADTQLVRSVVWDGATVPAGSHDGVIVYPGGVLETLTPA